MLRKYKRTNLKELLFATSKDVSLNQLDELCENIVDFGMESDSDDGIDQFSICNNNFTMASQAFFTAENGSAQSTTSGLPTINPGGVLGCPNPEFAVVNNDYRNNKRKAKDIPSILSNGTSEDKRRKYNSYGSSPPISPCDTSTPAIGGIFSRTNFLETRMSGALTKKSAYPSRNTVDTPAQKVMVEKLEQYGTQPSIGAICLQARKLNNDIVLATEGCFGLLALALKGSYRRG
ncbi:hypothetical protein AX774_g6739 [Zancudomyces culisetae]|uniref:Uncharacterized protein n=1 Tax=Zancudomyces culisetae TaxID=1213189 RepID=A0A1R1PFZ3_ZANCU|nr:hypothetical protein AX774_g6739 [Zancudomyces culisetae]|eukprot:OMH79838.1 hypothetical protein AX774_g6739 [Zancudomyces culisetae]